MLRFSQNNVVCVIGCTVHKINISEMTITLQIYNIKTHESLRRSERIPVSIYAEIRNLNFKTKAKQSGVIKDLSFHGLLICTKAHFVVGCGVEVDLHTNERIISLTAAIVRTQETENNNEYGAEIVSIHDSDLEFLKKHIRSL